MDCQCFVLIAIHTPTIHTHQPRKLPHALTSFYVGHPDPTFCLLNLWQYS